MSHPKAAMRNGGRRSVRRYPNGALVMPDGEALIVVEAKAQRLVRVPIGADGSAGEPSTVAELPDTDPDGVALAADGSLWVTLYRPDGLVRVSPDGSTEVAVDDRLASTFDAPTNIAWVGKRLDRVAIANVGDRFLSIGDLGVAGMPLHLPSSIDPRHEPAGASSSSSSFVVVFQLRIVICR